MYVHLSSAFEENVGDMTFVMPSTLPYLRYHREIRKHPRDAGDRDIEAIVWPIPFQPAIYSLEPVTSTSAVGVAGALVAVSGGKVAVIKGP